MSELGDQRGELATVQVERYPDHSRAALAGELDMSNADEIYQRLLVAARGCETLIVDLSGLAFIDSAGVAAIDRLNRTITGGTALRVVAERGSVPARTLALAGMDQVLPMLGENDDREEDHTGSSSQTRLPST